MGIILPACVVLHIIHHDLCRNRVFIRQSTTVKGKSIYEEEDIDPFAGTMQTSMKILEKLPHLCTTITYPCLSMYK